MRALSVIGFRPGEESILAASSSQRPNFKSHPGAFGAACNGHPLLLLTVLIFKIAVGEHGWTDQLGFYRRSKRHSTLSSVLHDLAGRSLVVRSLLGLSAGITP